MSNVGVGVDLVEHIGTLLGILSALLAVSVYLFWRTFVSVENKCAEVERIVKEMLIGDHFAKNKDLDREIAELWKAVNEVRRGEWSQK